MRKVFVDGARPGRHGQLLALPKLSPRRSLAADRTGACRAPTATGPSTPAATTGPAAANAATATTTETATRTTGATASGTARAGRAARSA